MFVSWAIFHPKFEQLETMVTNVETMVPKVNGAPAQSSPALQAWSNNRIVTGRGA
jgi:hypothetical protein